MIWFDFQEAFMEVSCPRCRKRVPYEGNPFRPFCSERCRLLDLGRWIEEEYAIPSEAPPAAEPGPDPEDSSSA